MSYLDLALRGFPGGWFGVEIPWGTRHFIFIGNLKIKEGKVEIATKSKRRTPSCDCTEYSVPRWPQSRNARFLLFPRSQTWPFDGHQLWKPNSLSLQSHWKFRRKGVLVLRASGRSRSRLVSVRRWFNWPATFAFTTRLNEKKFN